MKFGRYLRKSLATALIAVGGFNSVSQARFGDEFVDDCKALYKNGNLDRSKIDSAIESLCNVIGEEHFVSLDPEYSDIMGLFFWVMNELFKDKPVFAELQKRYFKEYPKADIRFFELKEGETFGDVFKRYGMKTVAENCLFELVSNLSVSTACGLTISKFDDNILVGLKKNSDKSFEEFINDVCVVSDAGFPFMIELADFRSKFELNENGAEKKNNGLFDKIYHCIVYAFLIIDAEMTVLSGKNGFWSVDFTKNILSFFDVGSNREFLESNDGKFLLEDKILDQEELEELKIFRRKRACTFAILHNHKFMPWILNSCVISQLPNVFEVLKSHELLGKVFEEYVAKFLKIKPSNI